MQDSGNCDPPSFVTLEEMNLDQETVELTPTLKKVKRAVLQFLSQNDRVYESQDVTIPGEEVVYYRAPENIEHLLDAPIRQAEYADGTCENFDQVNEDITFEVNYYPHIQASDHLEEKKEYGPAEITCEY